MSEDAEVKRGPGRPRKVEEPAAAGVKVVVMIDECFSSLGMHRKGEKVDLPEDDVAAMEAKEQVVRI